MEILEEQYLKAHDIFDSENSRFWTRFNIFTGMQLLIIAALAANYEDLMHNPKLAYVLVSVVFIFSVFTIAVMFRSYQISMGIFRSILEIERKSDALVLVETYTRNCRSPMGAIARYCLLMSVVFSVFWVVVFYLLFSP